MSEHEVQCECFISECLLIFLMPTHAINSLQKLFSIEYLGERGNGILRSLSSRSSSAIRNKQLTGSGLWMVHERGVENFCFRANRFHIKCLYFISVWCIFIFISVSSYSYLHSCGDVSWKKLKVPMNLESYCLFCEEMNIFFSFLNTAYFFHLSGIWLLLWFHIH